MPESSPSPLCKRIPDDIIAYVDGTAVPVGLFLASAAALATRLPARPTVINLSTDRYQFLLGFCAAVIAGQCTLMPPNRQRQTLLQTAKSYPDSYILGGDRVDGLEYFPIEAKVSDAGRRQAPMIADDQLCAVVFTSGSTGEAQPNRKSWRTLRLGTVSNASLVLDIHDRTLNVVATVPPQHMWGFEMSILLPLFARVSVSSRTPFFPGAIASALRELPRPRALVSSPAHLSAFLDAEAGAVEIDRIYSATAPMSAESTRRLEAAFAARLIEVFGCSESGIIAARRLLENEAWNLADAFQLKSDGMRTQIVADHLVEAVPLNDRIEILEGHRFRWLGRDADMVNIAGKRGSLADLNQRLLALPGVSDGVIFLPDGDARRLAALVVAPNLQPADILSELRDSIEPAFLPRPIFRVPSLPRQETGKLSRQAVLELFGELRQTRQAEKDDENEQAPRNQANTRGD
jgi:acyl-coenzyme A synthetase/AMP-(fatty) acid ligase